jgi:hypothetical protein
MPWLRKLLQRMIAAREAQVEARVTALGYPPLESRLAAAYGPRAGSPPANEDRFGNDRRAAA